MPPLSTEVAPIGSVIHAPGKLVLAGEYAVLDGSPAIVMAINSGVRCRVKGGTGIRTPMSDTSFVEPALSDLSKERSFHFEHWNPPKIQSDLKPGFGGSAAACVASVFAAGKPLSLAYKIHHDVQGSGSGIDVAASIHGGVVWFRRGEIMPLPPLFPVVVWSGSSAKTGPRVERYLAWPKRQGFIHASVELIEGFVSNPVDTTRALYRLLVDMANQAGIIYLSPNLEHIAKLAESCGGAAKPSGAGGGDCAIAFFSTRTSEKQFQEACRLAGYMTLDVQPSRGVHFAKEIP